jgi:hypothetical protein
MSRPALGPIQPPVQWVAGVLSRGIKRGRGVTLTTHPHLVPRSLMSRIYISSPPLRQHGVLWDCFTYIHKLEITHNKTAVHNFGFRRWAASNVESYPKFRQKLQLPSSRKICIDWTLLVRLLPALFKVSKNAQPVYILSEDICNVCRNAGKLSAMIWIDFRL